MFSLSCESGPVRPTDQNLAVKSVFAKQEHREIPLHSHSLLHTRAGTHTRARTHPHTLFFTQRLHMSDVTRGIPILLPSS